MQRRKNNECQKYRNGIFTLTRPLACRDGQAIATLEHKTKMQKSKLTSKQRISACVLRTELAAIETFIREHNYGYALREIHIVNERLNNYDWDKIRSNEK
jgi:hypothetical protein